MNRIPSRSDLGMYAAPERRPHHLDHSILTSSHTAQFHHAIFSPIHYEKNYAYPLLVWLHGDAGDERELTRLMPLISMRNYVAVAPRALWKHPDPDQRGYCWRQSAQATSEAAQLVFDCIELVMAEYHLASNRVFLGGHGSGGELALRIGLQHPSEFAGVLSLGGCFPRGNAVLGQLSQARKLPLLLAQGQASRVYPVDELCNDLRLFHAAGMCVTVRQYSCGDVIHQRMLHDMDVWMMEQVTGQRLAPCDGDSAGECTDSN